MEGQARWRRLERQTRFHCRRFGLPACLPRRAGDRRETVLVLGIDSRRAGPGPTDDNVDADVSILPLEPGRFPSPWRPSSVLRRVLRRVRTSYSVLGRAPPSWSATPCRGPPSHLLLGRNLPDLLSFCPTKKSARSFRDGLTSAVLQYVRTTSLLRTVCDKK